MAIDLPMYLILWSPGRDFHHLLGILLELAGLSIALSRHAQSTDRSTFTLLRRHSHRPYTQPVHLRHQHRRQHVAELGACRALWLLQLPSVAFCDHMGSTYLYTFRLVHCMALHPARSALRAGVARSATTGIDITVPSLCRVRRTLARAASCSCIRDGGEISNKVLQPS